MKAFVGRERWIRLRYTQEGDKRQPFCLVGNKYVFRKKDETLANAFFSHVKQILDVVLATGRFLPMHLHVSDSVTSDLRAYAMMTTRE